jgi:hypothetical protein
MTGRIKLAELKQREGLQGEVFKLFPSWHTGIIRGDDGNDVTFCEDSLAVGFSYGELSVGLRVSYRLLFATGAKVPTAVNLEPGQRTKLGVRLISRTKLGVRLISRTKLARNILPGGVGLAA